MVEIKKRPQIVFFLWSRSFRARGDMRSIARFYNPYIHAEGLQRRIVWSPCRNYRNEACKSHMTLQKHNCLKFNVVNVRYACKLKQLFQKTWWKWFVKATLINDKFSHSCFVLCSGSKEFNIEMGQKLQGILNLISL